jgi:hypothetical protein
MTRRKTNFFICMNKSHKKRDVMFTRYRKKRKKIKGEINVAVVVVDDVTLNGVSLTHQRESYFFFFRMLTHSIGMYKRTRRNEKEREEKKPVF